MPVIDELCVRDTQNIAVIPGLPVQTKGFELTVSGQNERPAGCFINTARFYADHPILHDVHAANAVGSPDFVQIFEQLNRRKPVAIQANGHTFFKIDCDLAVAVRTGTRIQSKFEKIFRCRFRWVVEDTALVADVPDVESRL